LAERPAKPETSLPLVTVDRLAHCHHLCAKLKAEGREFTSSQEIGHRLGYSPSQVRKDFARLGKLGTRGAGYRIDELQNVLRRILGKGRLWNVVLVGAGNLGRALVSYGGFQRQGFRFVAVFDADPSKVGTRLAGLVVEDVAVIPEVLGSISVEIGVVAVPEAGARPVAVLLAEHGVGAILSFAPTAPLPDGKPVVRHVDLAVELEKLCYSLMAADPEQRRSNLADL